MKSIRLNKAIRDEIVENVIKAWKVANPKPECIKVPSKQTLLEAAYKDWRESIGLDAKIKLGFPEEVLNHECYVNLIVFGENGEHVMYDGMNFRNDKGEPVKRVFKRTGALHLTTESPVYKAWKKDHDLYVRQNEEVKKWDVQRHDKAVEIRAVLDSVNTTKQLLEVWPEIERFMPASYIDPSRVALPAILPTLPTGE